MKEICQSRYEQETTEQEYQFLKQQITYYNSPSQSFQCSSLAQSILISIDSLPNIDVRTQIFNLYKETLTQSKADLFQLYMKSATDEREEYKKKYEDTIKENMVESTSIIP